MIWRFASTRNGLVPVVIPEIPLDSWEFSPAGWGDAAVICPWQIYVTYGDRKVLADQFESMKAWVDYIRSRGETEELWDSDEQLGDWLGLDAPYGSYKGATDGNLVATAYYAYSTSLLIKAGKVLGKDVSLYEKLYPRIVRAYQETYLDGDRVRCDTQTAQVLTLAFDLCPNKKAVADRLAELIHENGDRLTTGFLGTPYLLHVLSDNGYTDLAYTLLLQEEFPVVALFGQDGGNHHLGTLGRHASGWHDVEHRHEFVQPLCVRRGGGLALRRGRRHSAERRTARVCPLYAGAAGGSPPGNRRMSRWKRRTAPSVRRGGISMAKSCMNLPCQTAV